MALEDSNAALIIGTSAKQKPSQQQEEEDDGYHHSDTTREVIQQSDWELESVELDPEALPEDADFPDQVAQPSDQQQSRSVDELLNCSLDYFEGVNTQLTRVEMSGSDPLIVPNPEDSHLLSLGLPVVNGLGDNVAADNLIVESVEVFENPVKDENDFPCQVDKRSGPEENQSSVVSADENLRDDEIPICSRENETSDISERFKHGSGIFQGAEACERKNENPRRLSDRTSRESSSVESSESGRISVSSDSVLHRDSHNFRGDSEKSDDEIASEVVEKCFSQDFNSADVNKNENSASAIANDPGSDVCCNESDAANDPGEFQQAYSSAPEMSAEHDCLKNPFIILLANDLEDSRHLVTTLQETVNRLENQLSIEKSQAERISLLEQRIAQQERELELSKQEHDLDLRTVATLRKEMDTKLEALKKQYDKANKDKEAMVMRYVTSEKELIDRKKEREVLEKKSKEQQKENESLAVKLKNVTGEKTRTSQLLEQKTLELTSANKEIEKLKEEINSREIKIKWIQNRIKTEMDVHKECPEKIENLTAKVQQLEGDLQEARQEIVNLDKEHLENQFKKAFEQQMQEERAKLIVERHEHSEREAKLKTLQTKNQSLIEENNNLSVKVQNLEQERFDFEQKLIRAREDVRIYSQTVSELQSKIVQFDLLTNQLQQEKEKLETTSCELERLRKSNEELISDMSSCRNREAEMLAFTQKLTTKNVQLQSEFSAVEAKAAMLDSEHQRTEETMAGLKSRVKSLEREVKDEQARRAEEVRLMARQLAESATLAESLQASVEDYKGEISVLRNKHATAVRELQRELQQHKKKLDHYEAVGVGSGNGSLCQGSRTSSLSSLNNEPTTVQTTHTNNLQLEVAPQALVDRIVRLQHEIARQKERIEFLEDHSAQLTRELQKKSRLLQSYILREEAGALTSRSMDNNKAEVTKHGGIMASLYGSKLADDTMTLELSLEINHKLQAVLEDTLLKNITLKENIDTLGDEIARLSRQKYNN